MLIYLLRHAAVAKSQPHRFLGQSDIPLSEQGLAQARALAARLAHIPFTAVYASPLERAWHTAMLVSGHSGVDMQIVEELREINLGDWEGLTVAEVRTHYPGAYEARGADLAHFRPPGGESFTDLAERVWPALLNIARSMDAARDVTGPVLAVAHAGVNRVLLARISGVPLARLFTIPQDYGALNCLRYRAGSFEPVDAWLV